MNGPGDHHPSGHGCASQHHGSDDDQDPATARAGRSGALPTRPGGRAPAAARAAGPERRGRRRSGWVAGRRRAGAARPARSRRELWRELCRRGLTRWVLARRVLARRRVRRCGLGPAFRRTQQPVLVRVCRREVVEDQVIRHCLFRVGESMINHERSPVAWSASAPSCLLSWSAFDRLIVERVCRQE